MTKLWWSLIFMLFAYESSVRCEPAEYDRVFTDYAKMRDFMMEQMASAKKRIWLVTDYLTDGDIASGLFVAKYRKIDIQVLLSPQKSQKYMSRLGNLKANNILVYLKPRTYKSEFLTSILIDDRLYSLDAELDFLSKLKVFQMVQGTTPDVYEFARQFAFAVDEKNAAVPKDIPLVGRQGRGPEPTVSLPREPSQTHLDNPNTRKNLSTESGEAYHYNKNREKKPLDVSDRLPKSLKWDKVNGRGTGRE